MGSGAFQRDAPSSTTSDSAEVKIPLDMDTRKQTRLEIKNAIKQLKARKASGPPEFFETTTEMSNTLFGKSSRLMINSSQSSIFLNFYLIVECADRIVRELDASTKRET